MMNFTFPNGDKLEMKAIKRSEFASEETHCYQANLYLNGKHFATVGNDGNGGCDHQDPADGFTYADIKNLDERCQNEMPLYKSSFVPDGMPYDLEMWCGSAVDDHLMFQDMKKAMRSKVLVTDPKRPNKVFELSFKGVKKIAQIHLDVVAKKAPTFGILNQMPVEEAFEIYRTAN